MMKPILIFSILCIALGCGSCDSGADENTGRVIFQFSMQGDATGAQDFRAVTTDPVLIATLRNQLSLAMHDRELFPNGPIDRGNGGHNLDWNWHYVPDRWHLTELSIELCDGNALLVNQAVDYWVDTVGGFCPWSARVSAEIAGP